MTEFKDKRPGLCKWGVHNWLRDEEYKRHCLRCGERQVFIAGIGAADWVRE